MTPSQENKAEQKLILDKRTQLHFITSQTDHTESTELGNSCVPHLATNRFSVFLGTPAYYSKKYTMVNIESEYYNDHIIV